jgi:hypothetical protein
LANLLDDERNQAYYEHAFLLAISGLSHLYLGFAVLVAASRSPARSVRNRGFGSLRTHQVAHPTSSIHHPITHIGHDIIPFLLPCKWIRGATAHGDAVKLAACNGLLTRP